MKLKLKNKIHQAELKTSATQAQVIKNSSWEMSAQEALRVDYVTRKNNFPPTKY
jgi:hypothetical protein